MSILYGGDIEIPAETLAERIFTKLQKHPERILLTNGDTNRTYCCRWILAQTYRYVKLLSGQGLTQGDVIGLCSENSVEMVCIVYAALYLGLTINPLNYNYTRSELRHMISLTEPKIIFCSSTTEEILVQLVTTDEDLATTTIVVIGFRKECAPKSTVQLFAESAAEPLPPMAIVDPNESVAGIFASSGTTGLAKGVSISQAAFNFNVLVVRDAVFTIPTPEVRQMSFLPWFHVFGFGMIYYIPLASIQTVYLSRFESKIFLSSIQRHRITSVILVPPVLVFLSKDKLVDEYDLGSLREIIAGAAPLRAELEEAVYKRFPSITAIRQGYGMTEAMTLTVPPTRGMKQGSIGVLTKGTEAKVVHAETGELLGPNEPGELCFRGPHLMKNYFKNEEATKDSFDEDGFYNTGDVGFVDSDGYFFIVDRLKELIKYKGYQVPPAELESLLMSHPQVKDAAVIGVPDEACGELPMAYIVQQPGQEVSDEELMKFVAERTSNTKRLRGGVRFLGEIPKNPSGKIMRRTLRDLFKGNEEVV